MADTANKPWNNDRSRLPGAAAPHPDGVGYADVMLIAAHADDEGIFGGGLVPYYARVLGLNVVVLSMCCTDETRQRELYRAADRYAGNDGSPLPAMTFAKESPADADYLTGRVVVRRGLLEDTQGAPSKGADEESPWWSWTAWGSGDAAQGRGKAAQVVVDAIAAYRPRVLACVHNLHGDYGHTNHTAVAVAAVDGVQRARPLGHVEKLYLRGERADNTVTWSNPTPPVPPPGTPVPGGGSTDPTRFVAEGGLNAFFHDHLELRMVDGSSPRQIVDAGLRKHFSQYYLYPQVSSVYAEPCGRAFRSCWRGNESEVWTLVHSTKGADPVVKSTTTPTTVPHRETRYSEPSTMRSYDDWPSGDFLSRTSLRLTQASAPSLVTPPGQTPSAGNVSVIQFAGGSLEYAGSGHWLLFEPGAAGPPRTLVDGYFLARPEGPQKAGDERAYQASAGYAQWTDFSQRYAPGRDASHPGGEDNPWTDGRHLVLVETADRVMLERCRVAKERDTPPEADLLWTGGLNLTTDGTEPAASDAVAVRGARVVFGSTREDSEIHLDGRRLTGVGGAPAITDWNQRINGRAVRVVRFDAGSFVQTAEGTWTETPSDPAREWTEDRRDMWSVYLVEPEGERRVQIDVHRLLVRRAANGSVDYVDGERITAAW